MEKGLCEICNSTEICDECSGVNLCKIEQLEKLKMELEEVKSERDMYKRLYDDYSSEAFKYRNAFKTLVEELIKK
ncbi:hypothetical protein [Geobacillus phage GR1]|nr:hypothetical protein [Geobacillus phage GR1]